jgi:hypothetical protein
VFVIMQAVFRVLKVLGGRPHVAEVAVTVERAGRDEVTVSADAFGWRREVHGPGASVNGPADQLLAAEAVEGVRYVLARLSVPGAGYRVSVTRIWDTPVDTAVGDVKLAAALAVSAALGVELDPAPRLEATGAVFPD